MDLVQVGYVAKAHGIRGELRVVCHNPDSTALLDGDVVYIGDERFDIGRARPVNGAILLTVVGVSDRNRADELRGKPVSVSRDQLALDDGEFLLVDLEGCEVVLDSGEPYGRVVSVETGPQDRLVIVDGDIERLLPLVPEFVVSVDLDASQIVVTPPDGLPESRHRPGKKTPRGRSS